MTASEPWFPADQVKSDLGKYACEDKAVRKNGKELRRQYQTILEDPFPEEMVIQLGLQKLRLRKRTWRVQTESGEVVARGLRYGDNPDQPAALFVLESSDLDLKGIKLIQPHAGLVGSLREENLLQFGKHPGKTNLTDIDSALLVLRYLTDGPACAIMKHNNPCAVATAGGTAEAVKRAYDADPIAAFGGVVVVNRPVDKQTAEFLSSVYIEVLAAPEYEAGSVEILRNRKNLRLVCMPRLGDLSGLADLRFLDFKSLSDGSLIVQLSAVNRIRSKEDFLPARAVKEGREITPRRSPTDQEYRDMLFGWAVQQGVISNSVLFAKNGATVAIGAGGQDRVGVVKLAIGKAFDRLRDRLSLKKFGRLFFELELAARRGEVQKQDLQQIEQEVQERRGDLPGSVLVSDAFFPRRDGIDLALQAGATAVCHPGGSIRDWEGIEAVNEADPPAAMVFTGQRAFRH